MSKKEIELAIMYSQTGAYTTHSNARGRHTNSIFTYSISDSRLSRGNGQR